MNSAGLLVLSSNTWKDGVPSSWASSLSPLFTSHPSNKMPDRQNIPRATPRHFPDSHVLVLVRVISALTNLYRQSFPSNHRAKSS